MPDGPVPVVDASRPNAARVYDYLLGGRDNFAADRDLAGRLEAEGGGRARELAKVNRAFVLKSVRWVSSMLGISRFLDLGCGLPSSPAVHEAARDGCEGALVVYADHDPVVVSHAAALMGGPGLAAVLADASDPASVLREEAVRELLGPGNAACVILGGTLSAMSADAARAAVVGYAEALPPGSAVIISCESYRDEALGKVMEELAGAAGAWHNHGGGDVASFFAAAGLRLIRGQAGDVRCWPLLGDHGDGAAIVGGVGIRD